MRPSRGETGGATGWSLHNGDQRDKPDRRPRRSFDLTEKNLFYQLDSEEKKILDYIMSANFILIKTSNKLRLHIKFKKKIKNEGTAHLTKFYRMLILSQATDTALSVSALPL